MAPCLLTPSFVPMPGCANHPFSPGSNWRALMRSQRRKGLRAIKGRPASKANCSCSRSLLPPKTSPEREATAQLKGVPPVDLSATALSTRSQLDKSAQHPWPFTPCLRCQLVLHFQNIRFNTVGSISSATPQPKKKSTDKITSNSKVVDQNQLSLLPFFTETCWLSLYKEPPSLLVAEDMGSP